MAVWTGQSFTLNQILTSTQMNQLQADITALSEGASGAPRIQSGALERYNSFNYADLGDGSLGASTISANTNIDAGIYNYTNLTINSTYTLTLTANVVGPLIIRCTGTLTVSGTILCKNMITGGNRCQGAIGGGGGSHSTAVYGDSSGDTEFESGATGGKLSNDATDDGTAVPSEVVEAAILSGRILCGGSRGGDFSDLGTHPNAIGGDGGGVCIIIADSVVINSGGKIDCSGDDGGSDIGFAGGGGGGGGIALIFYDSSFTNNGTIDVTGGALGSGFDQYREGGAGGNGYSLTMQIGN